MKLNISRSSIYFFVTILIGVITVGTIQYCNDGGVVETETPIETTNGGDIYGDLQNKVLALRSGTFDPLKFDILEGSIDGYLNAKLITVPAANDLKNNLDIIFTNRVYNQCEIFLKNNSSNRLQVLGWLNLLQNKIGTNARIKGYQKQIYWYQYYSVELPSKVRTFVNSGVGNYEDEIYERLKNEVQNMPNLNTIYKNTTKFRNISKSSMDNLYKYSFNAKN